MFSSFLQRIVSYIIGLCQRERIL